jgi:hypothetical protein
MSEWQTVAILPTGAPLDAALAAMSGLGGVYPPHTLSLSTDQRSGAMVVLYDPTARAGEPKTVEPQMGIGLGVDAPGDLLAYAFAVTGEDQQQGALAIAAWLVDMLDRTDGAANFITFTFEHPQAGKYAMTLQRCAGKTPQEQITGLKQRLTELGEPADR